VNDQANQWVRFAPGKPVLKGVNWGGLRTLYIKEVRRFFKVQMQTVWAPAITTLLYLAIFTVALGRGGRTVTVVPGVAFLGSWDGHIRAYETKSGKIIWDFDTEVRRLNGVQSGLPISAQQYDGLTNACRNLDSLARADELIGLTIPH
jgi:outer membrane protein assembly factor BamB